MPTLRKAQRKVVIDPRTATPVEMLQDVLLSSFSTLDVTDTWPAGTVKVRGYLTLDDAQLDNDGLSPADVRRALYDRAESVISFVSGDLGYEHAEHPHFELRGRLMWRPDGTQGLVAQAELVLELRPPRRQ